MKTILETITPEIAEKYLSTMLLNRKVKPTLVNRIKRDIINNAWKVNGESIKFNTLGELIDGQHRLLAVMLANTSIDTLVTYDIDVKSFDTLDTGNPRSISDLFFLHGETDTNMLAAVLRWVWRYETKQMVSYNTKPTIYELQTVYERCPSIRDSFAYGRAVSKLAPKSLAASLHYLASIRRVRYNEADSFFRQLATGVTEREYGINKNSPVYILRNRLIVNLKMKAKLPDYVIGALIIKAFNCYVVGKPVRSLRFATEGDNKEEYPVII